MHHLHLTLIWLKTILLTGSALLLSATALAQSTVEFGNIWIAEAPPGSQVMVAYMNIKNTGSTNLILIPPKSNDFKKIEFHHSFHENGVARMQHQPELVLPAHSTLSLKPGDYHMMLFNPIRKLKAGDESIFSFEIEGNNITKVVAHVKKPVFKQMDHSKH